MGLKDRVHWGTVRIVRACACAMLACVLMACGGKPAPSQTSYSEEAEQTQGVMGNGGEGATAENTQDAASPATEAEAGLAPEAGSGSGSESQSEPEPTPAPEPSPEPGSESETEPTPEPQTPETSQDLVPAGANAVTLNDLVSEEELYAPAEYVAYADFDAMAALAGRVDAGECDGMVVQIDGFVSNPADGSLPRVVERSPDWTQDAGLDFVIEDGVQESYPYDGAHVIIVGKVVANKANQTRSVHTLAAFVTQMW